MTSLFSRWECLFPFALVYNLYRVTHTYFNVVPWVSANIWACVNTLLMIGNIPSPQNTFLLFFFPRWSPYMLLWSNPCSNDNPHSFAWPLLWSHMDGILLHALQGVWLLLLSMTSRFIQFALCVISPASLSLRIIPLWKYSAFPVAEHLEYFYLTYILSAQE